MNARARLEEAAWDATDGEGAPSDHLDAFLTRPDDLIALLVESGALERGHMTITGVNFPEECEFTPSATGAFYQRPAVSSDTVRNAGDA